MGTEEVRTLDSLGKKPLGQRLVTYLVDGKRDTNLSQTGGLVVGVPGMVRGLWDSPETRLTTE